MLWLILLCARQPTSKSISWLLVTRYVVCNLDYARNGFWIAQRFPMC